MIGTHFSRTVRNVTLKTGIGGHRNLCGLSGPGNGLRLLDQPLFANCQSLLSVKPWRFWVGFNKKTFSKALVRLLWTLLETEPKNQIQQKLSNYYESDIVEGILHILSVLILPQTLWNSYHHFHFTGEKIATQRRLVIFWRSHSWQAERVRDAGMPDNKCNTCPFYYRSLPKKHTCSPNYFKYPLASFLGPQAICQ